MTRDGRQNAKELTARQLALPAALVSLVFPGVGHLLIGMYGRAVTWFLGYVVFSFAVGLARPGAALVLSAIVAVDAYVLARATSPKETSSPEEVRQ